MKRAAGAFPGEPALRPWRPSGRKDRGEGKACSTGFTSTGFAAPGARPACWPARTTTTCPSPIAFRQVYELAGGGWTVRRDRMPRAGRVRLLRIRGLQPLRESRVHAGVPDRGHAQERWRAGHRGRAALHRLRLLRAFMPLPGAEGGPRGRPQREVRRMRGACGRGRAAHLRGSLPRCGPWTSGPWRSCGSVSAAKATCARCPRPPRPSPTW